MSSEVRGYEGDARIRDHQLLLLNQHHHHHHQQQQQQQQQQQHVYHVPQHSRREKLRFQSYEPPQASSSSSSAVIQDPSPSLLFPSIHGASSSCSYFSPNPNNPIPGTSYSVAQIPRFIADPLHPPQQNPHQSIPAHPRPPPCPVLDHGPSRPFTGYAAVLSGSRFLEPARQLLQQTCDAGRAGDSGSGSVHSDWLGLQDVTECGKILDDSPMGKEPQYWKRTKLVSMLDEVYRRYTHYYQQAQAIIQAFESVAGLSTAAPYVSMALQTMSKQFKCLANLISGQLRDLTNKAFGKEVISKEVVPSFGMTNCGVCGPRTASNAAFKQQPVWRPQRGLPERAVAVLRKWLFEHFLHPYPTDIDKQMLAKQTGLSRNQVSNWFINARVRLWKPMVEEIHSLEMRQSNKVPSFDRNLNFSGQPQLPPDFTAIHSENQPTDNSREWKNHFMPLKQFRDEICQIPNHNEHPFCFGSHDMSSHHDVGVGVGSSGGGNGGVTLTLGLRQSNGVCLAEPLHLNAVHGFGLEFNDTYCLGTMQTQDRQYARGMDGHLVRGFDG